MSSKQPQSSPMDTEGNPAPLDQPSGDSNGDRQQENNEQHSDSVEITDAGVMPITFLAVSFKEAALDSPTFRASTNHLSEQLEAVDRWIDGFNKATLRLSQEMDVLQEIVNYLNSRFVPEFVTQGLIDHDYTMLAMRRYAEALRYFWAGIIARTKSQAQKSLDAFGEFQRADLRSYKDCRRNFEAAQSRYDQILSRYASMSKNKEASSLREDAFQASEARKAYVKSCFDLCCITSTVQRRLDTVFIETLTDPWLLKKNAMVMSDPVYQRLGVDMHRIKSWSKVVGKSLKPIEAEMLKARKEMEDQLMARLVPSRDLNDYSVQNSTVVHFVPDAKTSSEEKHGWVFVKTTVKPARQAWVRRWAFVKNGMFGWLVLSPNKTWVQESDKIGVLLCNVSPEPNEDRRFCFEVRTKDTTLIMQAETLADLKSWLQVFEVAKRQVIQNDKESDMTFAFQRIYPLIPEFASTQNTSMDQEITHNRALAVPPSPTSPGDPRSPQTQGNIGDILHKNNAHNLQEIMTAGTSALEQSFTEGVSSFSAVGPFGGAIAPSPMLNTPMPTSMTKEAIVANSFIRPTMLPTAMTANYWGSVNWALYLKVGQLPQNQIHNGNSAGPNPHCVIPTLDQSIPANYPPDLQAQDSQMRAIFQTLVDNDPMDRVVMAFRGLISPNSKQELPGRLFITPRNCYIYSHTFGFTVLVKRPMSSIMSVEGHASTSWDTLYIVDEQGTSALCRVFLDSGRMIQKRIQYLLDIKQEEEPSLNEIIEKLKSMGATQRTIAATTDDEDDDAQLDDEMTKQLLQKYLTYRPESINANLPQKKIPQLAPAALTIDLANAMDQLVAEKEFDISAKALFHVMFGEQSDAFRYEESSIYKRVDQEITPWKVVRSFLEREMSFRLQSNGVLVSDSKANKKVRVVVLQRIEKMEDNFAYIVYERRPPWELAHGDLFYMVGRFVISADKKMKGRSKLSIYASVEWVRASKITRNVVESMVFHHFKIECQHIIERIQLNRDRLGKRGMAVTAIRMFGKLGQASTVERNKDLTKEGTEEDSPRMNQSVLAVNRYTMAGQLYEVTLGWLTSAISNVFILILRFLKTLWHDLNLHKLLVAGLVISALFNIFLASKTGVDYWAERHASRIMSNDLAISPSADTVMKRAVYLQDINDAISTGDGLTSDPESLCYQRFKSVAFYSPFDSADVDLVDTMPLLLGSLDSSTQQFARRIHAMRNELGVRRNSLIVSLATVNKLEQEALLAEWRKWLLSEVDVCQMVHMNLTGKNVELEPGLVAYCSSCMTEWTNSFDPLKASPK